VRGGIIDIAELGVVKPEIGEVYIISLFDFYLYSAGNQEQNTHKHIHRTTPAGVDDLQHT
jgi:hypothetical protein